MMVPSHETKRVNSEVLPDCHKSPGRVDQMRRNGTLRRVPEVICTPDIIGQVAAEVSPARV